MKPHLLACVLVLITAAHAGAMSYESRILAFFPEIVGEIQDHGLAGPIAFEVAQFAMLRRLIEDGLDRPNNISMNGMIPGSPNREALHWVWMPKCNVRTTIANDGQGCYVIEGPRANIKSAVAIAIWYDLIVNSKKFRICSAQERELWNKSKYHSHRIAIGDKDVNNYISFFITRHERQDIIRKVNRAYGPKGRYISKLREKLQPYFEGVVDMTQYRLLWH